MSDNIHPEYISLDQPVYGIFNDREPGTFILVGDGIYRAAFEKDEIKCTKIDSVHFGEQPRQLFFDADRQLIYGFEGREFHAIDLNTKQERKVITSFDGNDLILFSTLLKNKQATQFLIQTDHTGWTNEDSYENYSIYDFEKDTIIFKSDKFQGGGVLYPIGSDKLLFQKWNNSSPPQWFFTENSLTQRNISKFTDALSNVKITTWDYCLNLENRVMVGVMQGTSNYFMVRWNSDYSDCSILPFTFHKPKDRSLYEGFEISPDGNWIKGVSSSGDLNVRDDKLLFYHSDPKYPSGLSLAVYGGESHFDMNYAGAFVDTKQWGMVYIDLYKSVDGLLLVYKMSDVLQQIVKRAKEMVE